MTDQNISASQPKPKKRFGWLKIPGLVLGGLLVLLVIAYFVVTSSGFLKSSILPKVSKAINADVTVTDASISPFSSVVLRGFKVQARGAETLVTANEVRLRYSLMSILRGKNHVEEVTIVSPTVSLIENPDGTSNLDPILKATKAKEAKPKQEQPKGKSEPTQIDLVKLSITGGTVQKVKLYDAQHRDVIELSNFNLDVENVKNGGSGKMAVTGDVRMQNAPPVPGTNGLLQAKLNGNFNFTLTPALGPGAITGSTRLETTRAEGALATASGFSGELKTDVTPDQIKQLVLEFRKANAPLGQLLVSGPFSAVKSEGRLNIALTGIDKRLLDVVAAGSGLDFRETNVGSTNEVVLANGGKLITAGGQLELRKFQVVRTNQVTPVLDVQTAYNVVVDTTKSSAVIKGLTINGTQGGKPLLSGQMTSPMNISWGGAGEAMGDSAFTLQLTGLNLAEWKAFTGDSVSAGTINGQLKITSQKGGKQIAFALDGRGENLSMTAGTNRIDGAGFVAQANGSAVDMKQFTLPQLSFEFARGGQAVLKATANGTYATEGSAADFQFAGQVWLDRAVELAPLPDLHIASGTAEMKGRFTQKGETQNLTGTAVLAGLTAAFGQNHLTNFGTTADLEVGLTPRQIEVRKLAGKVTNGGRPGGGFDLTAVYNRTNNAAKLTAGLRSLNEETLRTFLEPAMTGKRLVSLTINGDATVNYDPERASGVTANMVLTNFIVSDSVRASTPMRLDASFGMDLALAKQVLDIRQLRVGLTPTGRGSNVVQMTGTLDMTRTNVYGGNLKLRADSLDLTRYYDLFVATNAPAQTSPRPSQPSPAVTTVPPSKGPETNSLPLRDFTAEAKVGGIYLHELEITNLQTVLKINGGSILLKPFTLAINGAPLDFTADLDLGVPGYKYDVAFRANQIPLAPVVDTFQPERRGQVAGTLTGQAAVRGQGTTGAQLKQTLAGNFDIGTTNLDLAIPTLRSALLKKIVNVIALVPAIVKNPNAAVGSLTGALFGSANQGQGGWTDELLRDPISIIQAKGVIGQGQIELQDALVESPAFQAGARGTVVLQDELTNSTINIPLSISVRRSLAASINMVSPGTPTNATYAKLPDYVTITGTVGKPDEKINKAALLGTVLQQLGGNIPGVDKKTGSLIQGLGGMLTAPRTNAASGSNAPSSGLGGLLQGLGGAPGNRPATNAPTGTNAPATNRSSAGNLLNQLLGPGKK
jgi:hypothetical protein